MSDDEEEPEEAMDGLIRAKAELVDLTTCELAAVDFEQLVLNELRRLYNIALETARREKDDSSGQLARGSASGLAELDRQLTECRKKRGELVKELEFLRRELEALKRGSVD